MRRLSAWLAGLLLVPLAHAQSFPQKPLRLIVPFTAGGATDIIARMVATELTDALGQNVVVENRGGGGAMIGTEIVARAAPDGHTLGLITPSFTINGGVRKLPYDPVNDFAAVGLLGTTPLILVTHPSLPVRNMQDLLALAKAQPGQLIYASSGPGSPTHMAMELLRFSGVRMTHIPYKGAAPALIDVVGGHVLLMQTSIIIVKPHLASGRLRAIAVTTRRRAPALPEVPAIAETIPGYEVLNWWGVGAPAKTPTPVVERLNSEILRAMGKPSSKERLLSEGAEAATSTPAEFAAMVREEIAKWARVAREIGLKLD